MVRHELLMGALVAAAACAPEPGTFGVTMTWEDGLPAPGVPLVLDGRIEVRSRPEMPGRVVASAIEPVAHAGPETAPLAFTEVPHGVSLTLIVEALTRAADRGDELAYYGLSDAFELEPGRDTAVAVVVPMRAVPEAALRLVAGAPRVRAPRVSVLLDADTAVTVQFSNEIAFTGPAAGPVLSLRDLAGAADGCPPASGRGVCAYPLEWDVTQGVGGCATACGRTIHARVTDRHGYARVVRQDVVLDTVPPELATAEVRLAPDASNPLPVVSAVTHGTAVTVTLQMSEDIASAALSAPGLSWVTRSIAGPTLVFDGVLVAPTPPDGCLDELTLVATDVAGNDALIGIPRVRARGPAAEICVDTTAPPPPTDVVLERAPWGSRRWGPVGRSVLSGRPGAMSPGATLIVRGGAGELRRGVAAADGSFVVDVAVDDPTRVLLSAVDGAGNSSGFTVVRSGVWIATPASGSPHEISGTGASSPARDQPDLDRDVVPGDAAAIDGRTVHVERTAAAWRLIDVPGLEPRDAQALAYDAARGEVVAVVSDSSQSSMATLVWDGVGWRDRTPPGVSPSPRFSHGLVYDASLDRVLIIGGRQYTGPEGSGPPLDGRTWEWDGRRWVSFTTATATLAAMGDLAHPMVAYDGRARNTVLVGGCGDPPTALASTWTYDRRGWSRLRVASGPLARCGGALAYEPRTGSVVLFGGRDADGVLVDAHTWVWDGVARAWSEVAAALGGPAPRAGHTIYYDDALGRLVMMGGGCGATGSCPPYAWNERSRNWYALSGDTPQGTTLPGFIGCGEVAYDAVAGAALCAPGGTELRAAGTRVTVRDIGAGGTQPGADQTVLDLGPLAGDGDAVVGVVARSGAVWSWNGARWTASVLLPEASDNMIAFDRSGLGLLQSRAQIIGTFPVEWHDFTHVRRGGTWLALAGCSPPTGTQLLAHDGRRFLRAGVSGVAPTHLLDLSGPAACWTPVAPAVEPPPATAMTYDAGRGVLVLVAPPSTWVWTPDAVGGAWSVATATGTPAVYASAMTYDPASRRVVAIAPSEVRPGTADTWDWDGRRWRALRSGFLTDSSRIAHHAGRGQLVLQQQIFTLGPRTFVLGARVPAQPGVVASFDFRTARVPTESVQSMVVRARVRGQGGSADASRAVEGASFGEWSGDAGRWMVRAESRGASHGFDDLAFTLTGTAASAAITGREDRIHALIRTVGGDVGAHHAALEVDDMELEIRYRLKEE